MHPSKGYAKVSLRGDDVMGAGGLSRDSSGQGYGGVAMLCAGRTRGGDGPPSAYAQRFPPSPLDLRTAAASCASFVASMEQVTLRLHRCLLSGAIG